VVMNVTTISLETIWDKAIISIFLLTQFIHKMKLNKITIKNKTAANI
jgi:hypothetical protein